MGVKLNEKQQQVIDTVYGYIRVIAGAGSGKTATLVEKYKSYVNAGVSTKRILAITFTNKAAAEMRYRVNNGLFRDKDSWICTFHSFCNTLLKEDGYRIGVKPNFKILDNVLQRKILKQVKKDLNLSGNIPRINDMIDEVLKIKGESVESGDYVKLMTDYSYLRTHVIDGYCITTKYIEYQHEYNALDYNDLIILGLLLLKTDKETRIKWATKFEYIMVDEFQDVSSSQYELADLLGSINPNTLIVGDPDQCIYEWRGSSIDYILNYPNYHNPCTDIVLDINYRSTQAILDAANSLICKNKNRYPKDLVTANSDDTGEKPVYYHADSIDDEAAWILSTVNELIESGIKYNDIAVLSRSLEHNGTIKKVQELFVKHRIPYILHGTSFYEMAEISGAINYLKLIDDPRDNLAFDAVVNYPPRKIGERRQKEIRDYAKSHNMSYFEALEQIHSKISKGATKFVSVIKKHNKLLREYEQLVLNDDVNIVTASLEQLEKLGLNVDDFSASIENEKITPSIANLTLSLLNDVDDFLKDDDEAIKNNISELISSIVEYENIYGEPVLLQTYLDEVSILIGNPDTKEKNAINIMTVHASKGLEFDNVFIPDFSENSFPSKKAETDEEKEAERRLAYVAYTRARKRLYISEAETFNGEDSCRRPSRFIFDTGKDNLHYIRELPSYLIPSENRGEYMKPLFKDGDRVTNTLHKDGTVIGEPYIDEHTFEIEYNVHFDKGYDRWILQEGLKLI